MLLISLFMAFSCNETASSSGGIFSSGTAAGLESQNWSMFLQPMLGLEKCFIQVEITGGSGSAVVSAQLESGGQVTELGNFTVYDGLDLSLSERGPAIKFSNNGGFNLVAPDQWVIMIDSGQLVQILPTGLNTSVATLSLVSAPTVQRCKYGLYDGFVNLLMPGGGTMRQLSIMPMRVEASEQQASGDIPETSMLLFSTAYPLVPGSSKVVKAGDRVEISYQRKTEFDGSGGDYFALLQVNGRNSKTVDDVLGTTEGKMTVTKKFKANGDFFGAQFVFGMSGPEDSGRIDNFKVRINGKEIFSDNFEGASLKNGLPDFVWQSVQPATMLGFDKICSAHPLSGKQSFCVKGGRVFTLYGQGASGGLQFTLTDGSVGSSFFEGSFMGFITGAVMQGTYSGRNFNSSCTEEGAFANLINVPQTSKVQGQWDLKINAHLKHCDNPADRGELHFRVEDIPVKQIDTLIGGLLQSPPVTDSLGNSLAASGFVNGPSLSYTLATTVPVSRFYRISLVGVTGERPLTGMVTGWSAANPMLLFSTCEVEGTFSLEISR
jgi:hypothetical protein